MKFPHLTLALALTALAPASLLAVDAPGSVDGGFNPGTGANDLVYSIAYQPNGKVLIGGDFTTVNGLPRTRIARLTAAGAVDGDFNADASADSTVGGFLVLPNGAIIVAGGFGNINGVARKGLARLSPNGALDATFVAQLTNAGEDAGPMALQPDGKIIVAGFFTSINSTAHSNIARLNADGTLDPSFMLTTDVDNRVRAIALQSDGKIVIGGNFSTVSGANRRSIARLNADGSLDTTFTPGAGANGSVNSVALQRDGKVLLGGDFSTCSGAARSRIARLSANGILDAGFNPAPNGFLRWIAVQPDDRILIGGAFNSIDGATTGRFARLNANGAVDATFDTSVGADNQVKIMIVQPDGKILLGGSFTSINGVARGYIGRVNGDPRGTLQFDAPAYVAAESLGSISIPVTRKLGSAGAVSVHYATANGLALGGSDFTPTEGNLSWGDGDGAAKTILIPITNDTTVEGDENFVVALSKPTGGAALETPSQVPVKIIDDDTGSSQPGVLQFSDASYSAAENSGGVRITVNRVGGSSGAVSVAYAAANGTALAGADYQAAEGTLNWANGDGETKSFTVPFIDDAVYEGAETFTIVLSGASGDAVVGSPALATVTILDNETAPPPPAGNLSFSEPTYSVVENAGSAVVTVRRTDGSVGAVSVGYSTSAGSAAPGTRYTNVAGTLSWPDGDATPRTFSVPVINNTVADGEQTVLLRLSSPEGGASLGSRTEAVLVVKDDGDVTPPPPTGDLIQAVNLLSPPTDLTVLSGQTIELYVGVEVADGGLQSVEFFAGDLSLGGSTAARDRKTWIPAAPGDYVLKAVATDVYGAQKSSFETIHVLLPQGDVAPPKSALLSGLDGRQFAAGSTIDLVAPTTDTDGTPLQSVEFYADGVLIGQAGQAAAHHGIEPKAAQDGFAKASVQLGNLIKDTLLTVVSRNSQGNAAVSAGATVHASQAAAADALTCAIVPPSASGEVSAGSKATVEASRAGGQISKVEFFVDKVSIGTATAAPYTFTIPALEPGDYALTAIATDSADVSKASSAVIASAVTVEPPVVTIEPKGSATAEEGGAKGKFLITRSNLDSTKDLTVFYKAKGSAKNGGDYTDIGGSIVIPAGETSVKIKIKAIDNNIADGTRAVTIKLLPDDAGAYTVGSPKKATVSILDND